MLGRVALTALLLASGPAAATQRLAIHATAAAALAADASHVRTLRDALTQAMGTLPAGYVVDASLVRLDVKRVGSELEVRVEVRAAMSDDSGRMRWMSSAKTVARGPQRDRALLHRDAITESARQIAKRLSAR